MLTCLMFLHVCLLAEPLVTHGACVRPQVTVHSLMCRQITAMGKATITLFTAIRLLVGVGPHVSSEGRPGCKPLVTDLRRCQF